jgi:outer membrane protein assembly factor BamE (lipoprotein component of BamABCDE complex)
MMRPQRLMKNSLVICLLLTLSFGSMANDGDRITQLEKEVQELKTRLTTLESPVNKAIVQKSTVTNDGWKSLASWRSLKNGMSYDEVKAILGEPFRIKGGDIAFWYYENRGDVTFYEHKVKSWSEPR